MNKIQEELSTLYTKYPQIEDLYKLTDKESQKLIDNETEEFNKEFSIFLTSNEDYLFSFVGSNLDSLKNHINVKFESLEDSQKTTYLELLKNNLRSEYLSFQKASKNKYYLESSHLFFYVKAFNKNNKRLLIQNVKEKKKFLEECILLQPQQINSIIENKSKLNKPNLNHWSENVFNLFNYLIENNYTGKKRQLTNIWHFFKSEFKDSDDYFKMTKTEYIDFIKETLDIQLTNFDKSEFKYEDDQKAFYEHKKQFEKA